MADVDDDKKPVDDMNDDELLLEGRTLFEEASDGESRNRVEALKNMRFARQGLQWPEDIRTQREKEGRPCLTLNKMSAFIRQVVNDARLNKPSMKARPNDDHADVETAKVISGLLRNIEYTSDADVAYDTAIEQAVSGGFGYFRVVMDYAYDDAFEMDLAVRRIPNAFSVYGDPSDRGADSKDWNIAFVTDRLSKTIFKRKYPKAKAVDWEGNSWSGLAGQEWLNDDGVMVAEWWSREEADRPIVLLSDGQIRDAGDLETDERLMMMLQAGMIQVKRERVAKAHKVTQRIMSGAEILETNDWPGRYIPLIPVYGEDFDIEGQRFLRSLMHNSTDAQRMYNYWRTASTELVALAPRVPYIGPKGAFASDIDRWNSANTKSHAYLEYDPVPQAGGAAPQRQPLDSGAAAGALSEAAGANDDIKSTSGIHDASLGQRSNETSGRAIMARQREGDISTFHFIDNMTRAIRHGGRIMIDLIPHVFTEERIIRILGEDDKEISQKINAPTPQLNRKGEEERDERGEAIMRTHDLTLGKYDLIVKAGPSFTSRREESAMQMTEAMRSYPPSAPIIAPLLAKNLDWPGADEIAEKFEELEKKEVPEHLKPILEKGQAEIQKLADENQKMKMDQGLDAAKAQQTQQLNEAKTNAQIELEQYKAQQQILLETEKMNNQMQLAQMKFQAERDQKAMESGGVEEIGEDGQKVVKTGTEILMAGLIQIGELIAQQSASNNAQLEQLAEIVAAPNELIIDPDSGRAIGSRKVVRNGADLQ